MKSQSLSAQITYGVSAVIVFVAMLAAVFTFLSNQEEAYEWQDDLLLQLCSSIQLTNANSLVFLNQRYTIPGETTTIVEQRSIGKYAEAVAGTKSFMFPADLPDGLQDFQLNGEGFRLVVQTNSDQMVRILVAQDTQERDEIAREAALDALIPYIILTFVLLLLLRILVAKILEPLLATATELENRKEDSLQSIDETSAPEEFKPFVRAINRLFLKIESYVIGQRTFISDAAHELRTPLTALSLQAERLAELDLSPEADERLTTLRAGIKRNQLLLSQLLAFTRAQYQYSNKKELISVEQVFRLSIENLNPLIEEKELDITFESDAEVLIYIEEEDLNHVIGNLLGNAILYSPSKGQIQISVLQKADGIRMTISDAGPGIKESERSRVFEPFYRIPGSGGFGSGLGLAIVKATIDRIGADISLDYAASDGGLKVTVIFPKT